MFVFPGGLEHAPDVAEVVGRRCPGDVGPLLPEVLGHGQGDSVVEESCSGQV